MEIQSVLVVLFNEPAISVKCGLVAGQGGNVMALMQICNSLLIHNLFSANLAVGSVELRILDHVGYGRVYRTCRTYNSKPP